MYWTYSLIKSIYCIIGKQIQTNAAFDHSYVFLTKINIRIPILEVGCFFVFFSRIPVPVVTLKISLGFWGEFCVHDMLQVSMEKNQTGDDAVI